MVSLYLTNKELAIRAPEFALRIQYTYSSLFHNYFYISVDMLINFSSTLESFTIQFVTLIAVVTVIRYQRS